MPRACAGLFYFAASICLCAQEPAGLLDTARRNALDFTGSLPDFLCTESIRRFQAPRGSTSWRPRDWLTLELSYVRRKENYRLATLNGQRSEKLYREVGGAFSTGEFGSWLDSIFSPFASADFRFQGRDTVRNHAAAVYSFRVARANSHYELSYVERGIQAVVVGYHGLLFIDLESQRVVRISLEADDVPERLPIRSSAIVLQ